MEVQEQGEVRDTLGEVRSTDLIVSGILSK